MIDISYFFAILLEELEEPTNQPTKNHTMSAIQSFTIPNTGTFITIISKRGKYAMGVTRLGKSKSGIGMVKVSMPEALKALKSLGLIQDKTVEPYYTVSG